MTVDNSDLIRQFVPATDDGDTYVYTELLDRRKTKGNNGFRLVKSFFHRDRESFDIQLPAIKELCMSYGCRAYTRISPRSFRKTAGVFLKMVTEAYVACNYDGMKTLYNKACGNVAAELKYWMFDVDTVNAETESFWIQLGHNYVAMIPSKNGLHYISKPFDIRELKIPEGIELKKDANTNLYIPENAE